MSQFKGILKVTEEQMQNLLEIGYIDVNGEIYYYDPYTTLYITDSEISIDNYLSAESLNPVENKVITTKINEIDSQLNTINSNEVILQNRINELADALANLGVPMRAGRVFVLENIEGDFCELNISSEENGGNPYIYSQVLNGQETDFYLTKEVTDGTGN